MQTPNNDLKQHLTRYRQIKISVIGRKSGKRQIPCSVARAVTVERAFRMPEPVNQESSADYFR